MGREEERQYMGGNPDTTANVYMQTIEEGMKQTLDAIYLADG